MKAAMRKMHYPRLPFQGSAHGVAELRIPIDAWVTQEKERFLVHAIQPLAKGLALDNIEEHLESAGLVSSALDLSEFFAAEAPRRFSLPTTLDGIRQLANSADDLARDDGSWKQRSEAGLNAAMEEAGAQLRTRFHAFVERLETQFGPRAGCQGLVQLRKILVEQQESMRSEAKWQKRQSDDLQSIAQQLRGLGRVGRMLPTFLHGWTKNLSTSWLMTESQRLALQRKWHPLVQKAEDQRFADETRRRKLRVYDWLLGQPGKAGLLDQMHQQSREKFAYFQSLVTPTKNRTRANRSATTIVLAESIDTPLEPGKQRTVADLLDERIRAAGCMPEDFAARIQTDGLLIRNRSYVPSQWPELALAEVRQALSDALDRYLGADRPHVVINWKHPSTALEQIAGLTLACEELQPLLTRAIGTWANRTRPFAEVHDVPRCSEKRTAYLFCHPSVRPALTGLLRNRAAIVACEPEAFAVNHPYSATLMQADLATPLGALTGLPTWRSELELAEKQGTALFSPREFDEVRRLASRSVDDAESLFDAACKADAIRPISHGAERFVPTCLESRFEEFFAQSEIHAQWLTPRELARHLRKPDVIRGLELAFPTIPDIVAVLKQASAETDANRVAKMLVDHALFESGLFGQCRIRAAKPTHQELNVFFKRVRGPIVGVSAEDFVALLRDNDDLYNGIFWTVSDADTNNAISRNDIAESLQVAFHAATHLGG